MAENTPNSNKSSTISSQIQASQRHTHSTKYTSKQLAQALRVEPSLWSSHFYYSKSSFFSSKQAGYIYDLNSDDLLDVLLNINNIAIRKTILDDPRLLRKLSSSKANPDKLAKLYNIFVNQAETETTYGRLAIKLRDDKTIRIQILQAKNTNEFVTATNHICQSLQRSDWNNIDALTNKLIHKLKTKKGDEDRVLHLYVTQIFELANSNSKVIKLEDNENIQRIVHLAYYTDQSYDKILVKKNQADRLQSIVNSSKY